RLVEDQNIGIGKQPLRQHDLLLVAADGKGVLMISSEMPELLGTCDRIYVMNEGSIVAELPKGEASQETIMRAIMRSGEKRQ
ncbi:hypothetical protein ACC690_37440, partial [Rhizobium johnstonii]